ncbi:hypothetical protein SLA2020_178400 [Shorea laevis]
MSATRPTHIPFGLGVVLSPSTQLDSTRFFPYYSSPIWVPPAAVHIIFSATAQPKGKHSTAAQILRPDSPSAKKKKKKVHRTLHHLGLRSPFLPSSGCGHLPSAVVHWCSLFSSPPLTAGEGQKLLGCLKQRESISAIGPRKGFSLISRSGFSLSHRSAT